MKHLRIESLIIALGLVCAGAFIYFGIEAFGERSRTVEVRGFSERIVDADKATWPIRCKLRSDDVADIYNQAKSATDKIKTYLVNNGIDAKDITTSAPKVTDYRMQDWKPENVSSRYVADVTVTVSTPSKTPSGSSAVGAALTRRSPPKFSSPGVGTEK